MGCVPDLLRTRLGNGRAMHERTLMHQVILPGTRACRAVTCSRLSLARMGTSRLAADRTDRLSGQRHIVPSCRWSGDRESIAPDGSPHFGRSEEHTSELQSLMRISDAV